MVNGRAGNSLKRGQVGQQWTEERSGWLVNGRTESSRKRVKWWGRAKSAVERGGFVLEAERKGRTLRRLSGP